MKQEQGLWCPLIRKDCVKNKCAWFTEIRGYNPNTGQDVDEWSCAVAWVPMLFIENSQQQRSTAAAVESFRNESVKSSAALANVMANTLNPVTDVAALKSDSEEC